MIHLSLKCRKETVLKTIYLGYDLCIFWKIPNVLRERDISFHFVSACLVWGFLVCLFFLEKKWRWVRQLSDCCLIILYEWLWTWRMFWRNPWLVSLARFWSSQWNEAAGGAAALLSSQCSPDSVVAGAKWCLTRWHKARSEGSARRQRRQGWTRIPAASALQSSLVESVPLVCCENIGIVYCLPARPCLQLGAVPLREQLWARAASMEPRAGTGSSRAARARWDQCSQGRQQSSAQLGSEM